MNLARLPQKLILLALGLIRKSMKQHHADFGGLQGEHGFSEEPSLTSSENVIWMAMLKS